jgi:hypothetical protein
MSTFILRVLETVRTERAAEIAASSFVFDGSEEGT